jgi:hypothetical protein
MRKKLQQTSNRRAEEKHKPTPTFLLELPLRVTAGQATRVRAHLEAARQLYNAVLSEGQRRLRRMRADPAWQAARAIPRIQKQERKHAFGALRAQYGFSGAIRFRAPSNEWRSCLKRPRVRSDVRGKQHAPGSGTARGVKPADNA